MNTATKQDTWKEDEPEAVCSGCTRRDENGNTYRESASRKVVTCTTPEGFAGTGWTAEDALARALEVRGYAQAAACDMRVALKNLLEAFELARTNCADRVCFADDERVTRAQDVVLKAEEPGWCAEAAAHELLLALEGLLVAFELARANCVDRVCFNRDERRAFARTVCARAKGLAD
jgi:hypothetical protein